MSQADKGNAEPSMEEILASIRRIISDDKEDDVPVDAATADPQPEGQVTATAPPSPNKTPDTDPIKPIAATVAEDLGAAPPALSEEVPVIDTPPQEGAEEMELTEILDDEPATAVEELPAVAKVLDAPPIAAPVPPVKTTAPMANPTAAPKMAAVIPVDEMVPETDAVPDAERSLVSPPVRALSTNMLADLAGAIHARGFVLGNVAMTLEDLTRDLMRPHLKEWLDKNLPGIVERMVRAEIERMVREAEARKDLI